MKDTWQFLSHISEVQVMAEHKIYQMLYYKDTLNIPQDVVDGDIDGRETRTQKFLKLSWLCVRPRISPFQHYQVAHPIVRRVLTKFDSMK